MTETGEYSLPGEQNTPNVGIQLRKAVEGARQHVSLFFLFAFPAGSIVPPRAFRAAVTSLVLYHLPHNVSMSLDGHSHAQVT